MKDVAARLVAIADSIAPTAALAESPEVKAVAKALQRAVDLISRSASGAWIGYQAAIYYRGFQQPRPGDHWSIEWGRHEFVGSGGTDNWVEVTYEDVEAGIRALAGHPDTEPLENAAQKAEVLFKRYYDEVLSIVGASAEQTQSAGIREILGEVKELHSHVDVGTIAAHFRPGQIMSRDSLAMSQGVRTPHHIAFNCWVVSELSFLENLRRLEIFARRTAGYIAGGGEAAVPGPHRVFIGHGQDTTWLELKEFLKERLGLEWDEFNRVSAAGVSHSERLLECLNRCTFAFLVMTAEDEHADATRHARENVIHEAGLFQGHLGFRKAIILLEDDCKEFGNIHGLGQVRFAKSHIADKFEEVRRVLEREGVIPAN